MKGLMVKFRMNMAAVAFAEMAEWEAARQLAPSAGPKDRITWWDRFFMAVTFAEHGLHAEAADYADRSSGRPRLNCEELRNLGLTGAHMVFGVIQVEAECR